MRAAARLGAAGGGALLRPAWSPCRISPVSHGSLSLVPRRTRCTAPQDAASAAPSVPSRGSRSSTKRKAGAPARSDASEALVALRSAWDLLWEPGDVWVRQRIGAAFILMLGGKAATIQVPFLFKYAIDGLSEPAAAAAVAGGADPATGGLLAAATLAPPALMLAYGGMRIAADGMTQLRNALFSYVTEDAIRRVSLRTFNHLMALDLAFHLDRQTGALTRIVERGTRAVGTVLSMSVLHVIPTAIEVSVVSALLAYKCGPAFAAVTLGTIGLYSAFTFGVTRWRTNIRRQQNQAESQMNHRFTDSLLNYETVHYFGAAGPESERFDIAASAYQRASLNTALSLAALNFGQSVVFSAGVSGTLLLAANEVLAGQMTVGDVVMVHGLVFQLTLPLNILGSVYNMVRQAAVDMNALTILLESRGSVVSDPRLPPLGPPVRGLIEFDRASFGYTPEHKLLQDVSFRVEPGQTCAVVGASGSGKSTILRLLFRFFDVQGGAVRIDGRDVREVELGSLRRAIGVIPQDVVLFNDTVAHNLAYGRPDASREEIEEAARRARIHDAVTRMPSGYETIVGERGLKLSGGEKQRVAIGRALLKDAPVLLCDEATSAVDTVTEAEIFAALRSVAREPGRQRTCIMIAHRLSTVVDADLIVVLRAGRVVETGTHATLLALAGEYAQLWAMQQASSLSEILPAEDGAPSAAVVPSRGG